MRKSHQQPKRYGFIEKILLFLLLLILMTYYQLSRTQREEKSTFLPDVLLHEANHVNKALSASSLRVVVEEKNDTQVTVPIHSSPSMLPTHQPTTGNNKQVVTTTSSSMTMNDNLINEKNAKYRAIVSYFPANMSYLYLPHLKWLHRSWKEMKQYETTLTTDLVIISHQMYPFLEELNCSTEIRSKNLTNNVSSTNNNSTTIGRCIIIPGYKSVSFHDEDLLSYGYADSIATIPFAAERNGSLDAYDLILRTDLDVFVTPSFANWIPNRALIVGDGQYCFHPHDTCKRLKEISKKMGLLPWNESEIVENIGSTWYGNAKVVIQCSALSITVMKYLSRNEFTKEEKSLYLVNASVINWPRWHFGVLTMYGGQIAINHCTEHVGGFEKHPELLDFPSHSSESIDKIPHLHTWATRENFSKGLFYENAYKDFPIDTLNISIVKDYAMFMALDANDMGKRTNTNSTSTSTTTTTTTTSPTTSSSTTTQLS
jgi:hypothetical protein